MVWPGEDMQQQSHVDHRGCAHWVAKEDDIIFYAYTCTWPVYRAVANGGVWGVWHPPPQMYICILCVTLDSSSWLRITISRELPVSAEFRVNQCHGLTSRIMPWSPLPPWLRQVLHIYVGHMLAFIRVRDRDFQVGGNYGQIWIGVLGSNLLQWLGPNSVFHQRYI